ncbi:MAG: sigma-70 family RNA polymerase sigma factor [Candidatus Izemoplasma sp.]|nr:sigma-70 family RNA polymerase sigma factor [Candidatus Izemoplasma sp.]
MTDQEIIHEVLSNNKDAFALIMDRYHNELFKYVYNMTGNVETTEDLLQEIFMKIYQALSDFDADKASFRTWMYRIAMYHTYNYFNRKAVKHIDEYIEVDLSLLTADEDIIDDVIKEDQLDRILDIIKTILKPKHQKIMLLHFLSGLSVKEISQTLDIPDKTIYKAIKTSIEKIKKEVQANG